MRACAEKHGEGQVQEGHLNADENEGPSESSSGLSPTPALVGLRCQGELDSAPLQTSSLSFLLCLSASLCLSVSSPPLPVEAPNSAPGPNMHNSFSQLFSMASLWPHSPCHPQLGLFPSSGSLFLTPSLSHSLSSWRSCPLSVQLLAPVNKHALTTA